MRLTNEQGDAVWEHLKESCWCCVGRAFIREPEFMWAVWNRIFDLEEDRGGADRLLRKLHECVDGEIS